MVKKPKANQSGIDLDEELNLVEGSMKDKIQSMSIYKAQPHSHNENSFFLFSRSKL